VRELVTGLVIGFIVFAVISLGKWILRKGVKQKGK
jgi:hypothetical protein